MRIVAIAVLWASIGEAQNRGVGYTPPPAARGAGPRVWGGRGGGWVPWGGFGGPNVTVVNPAPEAAKPATPMVASPTYQADKPKPEMREYGSLPAPGPVQEESAAVTNPAVTNPAVTNPGAANAPASIQLIALRTGGVEAVRTYWYEGSQLHFVTAQYEIKEVALSAVDRPLTELLNRKRGIEFRWP